MSGPVPVDVLDRLRQRIDDLDRHLQPVVLGVPILDACLAHGDRARIRAGILVADQLDAGAVQLRQQRRQQLHRHRAVNQQRLRGVADAGPLHLCVVGDPLRHLGVGVLVHIDVAVAGRRVHHRHLRHLLQRLLQPLAPPRDDQIHQVLLLASSRELLVAASGQQRDRRPGRPASSSDSCTSATSSAFEVSGARPPQHHRVPALQAERRGVDGHVRPRLVDDPDHADRRPLLRDLQPVRQRPALDDLANRVRQACDLPHAGRHLPYARLVQGQPVEQRLVQALLATGGDIRRVRLQDLCCSPLDPGRQVAQAGVLGLAVGRASTWKAPLASRQTSATLLAAVAIDKRVIGRRLPAPEALRPAFPGRELAGRRIARSATQGRGFPTTRGPHEECEVSRSLLKAGTRRPICKTSVLSTAGFCAIGVHSKPAARFCR